MDKIKIKQNVLQLLQDTSVQDPTSDSYEQRIIRDNDFENVAESIVNMLMPEDNLHQTMKQALKPFMP